MKNFLLYCVLFTGALASCVDSGPSQFSEMPAGPLQKFTFHEEQNKVAGGEMIVDIQLWRNDTIADGGWLSYESCEERPWESMPQPLRVGEALFDSVYNILKQERLYAMATHYSTSFKGDAYGYSPWTLTAVLPNATICTETDGTSPSDFSSDSYTHPVRFLENFVREQGLEWLKAQPIDLSQQAFYTPQVWLHSTRWTGEDSVKATTTANNYEEVVLCNNDDDEVLQTFYFIPTTLYEYTDTRTKAQLKLKWVNEVLTATLFNRSGDALWAMVSDNNTLGRIERIKGWYITPMRKGEANALASLLREEVLDTYILQLFSPEERQNMLSYLESLPTLCEEEKWNHSLLQTFGTLIPFDVDNATSENDQVEN